MDFFFDDVTLPSTSQSTANDGQEHVTPEEALHMIEDTDSSRGKSSSMSMTESQEHHTSSSIDDISRRVQELVEKINDSRTTDQKVLDSFQEKLVEKVTEMCQQMKEHMYTIYEDNSNEMQVKLQELSEVLESCTKLNSELLEASQALASLRGGLAISQTSEP
ncbi:synaptonemal complex central element protein 2 [Anoplopoma fimbria]|uniref:synaptonemal complex central element protein 2 n=1 Tax=Anoplopoma fimbria TaxID=229290 RepID=UPI0023EAC5C9|nr:synaptonemal complex central element protein 2 [Anoplopoma fimbria]XP_054460719.1 synaptonemal complex central element protein 2 [Anoplopoma fimbria]XP_054460720.1 synaptonemal complex central element protein 2 [Anoplopoma fimbria]